jgi:hypothetical protein
MQGADTALWPYAIEKTLRTLSEVLVEGFVMTEISPRYLPNPSTPLETGAGPLWVCTQGHQNESAQHYCGTCGERAHAEDRGERDRPEAGLPTSFPPPPTAKKSRKVIFAGIVVAAALAATGAVLLRTADKPNTVTIRGIYTLTDIGAITGSWDSCQGDGGYSDFGGGEFITVTNEKGDTIGGGTTRNLVESDAGVLQLDNDATGFYDDAQTDGGTILDLYKSLESSICTVAFDIDVDISNFYTVEIGHRGASTYSQADLQKDSFFINLSLGN